MKLKHLNIKPKVFPSYLRRKRKRLALIEPRFSKHNGLCFGPKWLAWLNGQWESVLRVSAWVSRSQQMQWKWTPFFMETKEKKNILIQLRSCLYDYMWKWTLACTVTITSVCTAHACQYTQWNCETRSFLFANPMRNHAEADVFFINISGLLVFMVFFFFFF